MVRSVRVATLLLAGMAAASLSGCQKTDSTDDTLKVDDFVVSTTTPSVATADGPGTGKTYRIVRGVTLSSASTKVQQASGGIVNPPTGGDVEHYEYVSSASSNKISAVGGAITQTFEVWYDLPSLRREALVTLTLNFTDDSSSPKTFTKTVNVQVAP